MKPVLSIFMWCQPHVRECVECRWLWFEVLARELVKGALDEDELLALGLDLPSEEGSLEIEPGSVT